VRALPSGWVSRSSWKSAGFKTRPSFRTPQPPDPHLRFDTNDYSLDPHLVGRRVEVRASQREIVAVALDTGELACRHERSFAKNRTITALEHARALRERRGEPQSELVEQRPLAVDDRLIA
jgi:hypothetical protein